MLAIVSCAFICYQDFRERLVFWFLFSLLGFFLGLIFFLQVPNSFFLFGIVTNTLLVALILMLLYAYAKFFLKKPFANHSLGMGDMLFFYAMAVGFPPITFMVLFAGAIFFSLISHLVVRKRYQKPTVPLAGFMGIYLMIILFCSLFFESPSLYTL